MEHLDEISLEKMDGEDTLQESPEWIEMFSKVCVLHESILEFLQKKKKRNIIVDPWSTLPQGPLSDDFSTPIWLMPSKQYYPINGLAEIITYKFKTTSVLNM